MRNGSRRGPSSASACADRSLARPTARQPATATARDHEEHAGRERKRHRTRMRGVAAPAGDGTLRGAAVVIVAVAVVALLGRLLDAIAATLDHTRGGAAVV